MTEPANRSDALDQLTAESEKLGLYDAHPETNAQDVVEALADFNSKGWEVEGPHMITYGCDNGAVFLKQKSVETIRRVLAAKIEAKGE